MGYESAGGGAGAGASACACAGGGVGASVGGGAGAGGGCSAAVCRTSTPIRRFAVYCGAGCGGTWSVRQTHEPCYKEKNLPKSFR